MHVLKNWMMLTLAALMGLAVGCEPDPQQTLAEISVYNELGKLVSGAEVRLYCTENNCVIETTQITNSRGFTLFEFDQPVVLAIEAVKYDTTVTVSGVPPNVNYLVEVDTAIGTGLVRVFEHERNQEAVIIETQ